MSEIHYTKSGAIDRRYKIRSSSGGVSVGKIILWFFFWPYLLIWWVIRRIFKAIF